MCAIQVDKTTKGVAFMRESLMVIKPVGCMDRKISSSFEEFSSRQREESDKKEDNFKFV